MIFTKNSSNSHGERLIALLLSFLLTLSLAFVYSQRLDAQTWWFGKNKVQYRQFKWEVLRTPHFDVNFPEGHESLAAKTAVVLEYGYNKLSRDFLHNISWRIPVIVYGSHADFQQTNVTWSLIPEGVQAFAEPMRRRMVLHFSGSNSDFIHTTVHELVHIFTFDMVYGSLLQSVFSRNFLFQIPLWFAEGTAEYYSIGYDKTAEMFMRDATVHDYLMDLDQTGGYMVYKSGQAAIYYLNETYGNEKVIEIMDHLRHQRSMELALKTAIGISTRELSRDWKRAMRRKYWPLYADKKDLDDIAVQLTDHIKHHHYMNTKPEISPDGEHIVYFSDLKGLDGIYLMNAVTGKVEKKLVSGTISTRFESIKSMKSSLTYSPDGSRVAFVAKSKGFDRLFIVTVRKGRVLKEVRVPLDFFYSPAWSPSGKKIVFVGVEDGQTDLYLYDLDKNSFVNLTNDPEDEQGPAWFPDGERIAYSRHPIEIVQPYFKEDSLGVKRLVGVDYKNKDNVKMHDSDIWLVDIESGVKKMLLATPGNDNDPVVMPDGKEIIFTSDENGISNLYRGTVETGSYYRFTDVLGGIFSPSYSSKADRLVFSAFNSAGFDIYVMYDFSEKSRRSYSTGGPKLAAASSERKRHIGPEVVSEDEIAGTHDDKVFEGGKASEKDKAKILRPWTNQPSEAEGAVVRSDTSRSEGRRTERFGTAGAAGVASDTVRSKENIPKRSRTVGGSKAPRSGSRRKGLLRPDFGLENAPDVVVNEDSEEEINPDTLKAIRDRMRKQVGTIQPYHVKFAPDYVGNGAGLFYSTGFGFGLMNQIAFSDLLGDHHLYIMFNLYRSIEDSDIMVTYYYLKKRIDYAFGVFQYKNYLNSRVSSIGESFFDYRFFTERNYGAYGLISFPFSTFTRMDLEMEGFVSERKFFYYAVEDETGSLNFFPGEKSRRRLIQPTLSFVHDSALFNSLGPVIGSRWMVSISKALSFSGSDVSRSTAFVDYRKYFPLFYRNYLALRAIGAVSTGEDRRYFFLGGPLTMRGYDYLQLSGPRMLLFNAEYRFPLIDAIIFGWPGRWGFRNIGGTFFLDSGSVWGEGYYLDPVPSLVKPRVISGLKFYSDFGVGFYMNFGYLILNFQIGWPTDFSRTGDPVFHFFLGPMF